MTADRRLVPAGRSGEGATRAVSVPVADLLDAPDGTRVRQLLLGEAVGVREEHDGWAFVEAPRIGYVGYLSAVSLGQPVAATHVIAAPASHLYAAAEVRARDLDHLSFGSRLRVVGESGAFYETASGAFVPRVHLRPINRPMTDPATVAQLFLGAPYLWGGNSIRGIDCSGLVQAAHLACGVACPADSDQQQTALGRPLAEAEPLRRGDLMHWKGHVAMAVDGETLIHANAHHMAVACEPAAAVIARIAASGGGGVTARRRIGV